MDIQREFDPNIVIGYDIPLKKAYKGTSGGFALDCPRRFAKKFDVSPADELTKFNPPSTHARYYVQATCFAEHSQRVTENALRLRVPDIEELLIIALEVRSSGSALPAEIQRTLKRLKGSGPTGAALSTFLHQLASESELPDVPREFSPSHRRQIEGLLKSKRSQFIKISPIDAIGELVYSSFTEKSLTKRSRKVLSELRNSGGDAPAVAECLSALFEGRNPRIPTHVRPKIRSILKDAKNWITKREVPSSLFSTVATQCLEASFYDEPVSTNTEKWIKTIAATGGDWPQVAQYLRLVAKGKNIDPPSVMTKGLAKRLNDIKLVSKRAGVQVSRVNDIMAAGIADPNTNTNLLAIVEALGRRQMLKPEEIEAIQIAIAHFVEGTPERRPLASLLMAYAHNSKVPKLSERAETPVTVFVAMMQVQAIINGQPIPINPDLVGHSAIHARFSSQQLGDCALLSLMCLSKCNKEAQTLAKYLWDVGRGASASPAPILANSEFQQIATEVRNLSAPEVGGIRMTFSLAE
jgi:hypothetical protein